MFIFFFLNIQNMNYILLNHCWMYEVSSEKLPGFAATKQTGVRVERSKAVETNIVPDVSSEGVLCLLYVTAASAKRQKNRKRYR